ncbi:MAG: TVP38/TMEM64 family protein [Candidatus Binatia bacterium]
MKTKTVSKSRRLRIWLALVLVALLFAVAAAWRWTPLAEQIDIGTVSARVASLRSNPAHPWIILAVYVVGSLVLVPITVLIIATAAVFGPVLGSAYSLAGCLLGAGVTYAVGYFLGKDFVRQITGAKWARVERKIGQTGILAVAVIRLLPIAPFTVVNVISGAFQVPLWQYVLGSLLGLVPGILVINLFAHQFERAIRNPGMGSFLLFGALIVITVWGTLWVRRKLTDKS